MRAVHLSRVATALVFAIGGMCAATQNCALTFGYTPLLRPPLARVGQHALYPPWAWLLLEDVT
jgi:hypothetical protein